MVHCSQVAPNLVNGSVSFCLIVGAALRLGWMQISLIYLFGKIYILDKWEYIGAQLSPTNSEKITHTHTQNADPPKGCISAYFGMFQIPIGVYFLS